MEYLYRNISIYVDSKNNLYIVPTGKSDKEGAVELDLITKLNSPYSDEDIENTVKLAFDQCFTMKPVDNGKETAIEKFLQVKGYAKAVKDKRLIAFFWDVDEGFKITPTQKLPRQGYCHLKEKANKLGLEPKPGEIARALREAMQLSTP